MTIQSSFARRRPLFARFAGVLAVIAAAAVLCSPSSAQTPATSTPAPPPSSEPQVTTASYADWVLRCHRVSETPQSSRVCEVQQSVQAQQATILQIAFARANPRQPLQLTIVVPANVSFPSTPRVSIDDKDPSPVDLVWRRCVTGGCVADATIDDDKVKRWRAQTERGRVLFKDAAGRDTTIPFSFRGLAQALDALAKG